MAIVAGDIDFFLSGGVANSDPNASIGGAISSTQITTSSLHNLFDAVSGSEASSGDVEFRCIYVKNSHGSLTLQNTVIWISSNTPSTDTTIDIGLGSSAIDGTEQTVAGEGYAPTSVTFSAPSTLGTGLSIGDLTTGQTKAVWIRRTVSSSASVYSTDTVTLNVGGDTAA